jgi:hypothetical protein
MHVPGEPPQQEHQDATIVKYAAATVVFTSPSNVIWRYMPLEQLFALLSKKALHFSPLAVMEDISEGTLPPSALEETKKQLPQHILEAEGGIDSDAVMAIMVDQRRRDACINCWYMDESESIEMWKKYAPRNGVAIQSTVGQLGSSFLESGISVTIGPVTYFKTEESRQYSFAVFTGNLYIKHDEPYGREKELRALVYRPNVGNGVDIPVNVAVLAERLVLSPELADWAVPYITEAIRHFSFAGPIEKSHLDVAPSIPK